MSRPHTAVSHQQAIATMPTSGPPSTESSGASSTPSHSTRATVPATKCVRGTRLLMERRPAAASLRSRSLVSTIATAARAVRIQTTIVNDMTRQSALEAWRLARRRRTVGTGPRLVAALPVASVPALVLELGRQPGEQGVHVGHAVAAEREREAHPTQVLRRDRP